MATTPQTWPKADRKVIASAVVANLTKAAVQAAVSTGFLGWRHNPRTLGDLGAPGGVNAPAFLAWYQLQLVTSAEYAGGGYDGAVTWRQYQLLFYSRWQADPAPRIDLVEDFDELIKVNLKTLFDGNAQRHLWPGDGPAEADSASTPQEGIDYLHVLRCNFGD